MARRFLYLSSGGLSAFRWQRAQIVPEESFGSTEAGLADFTSYLEAHKNSLFFFLANLRDQGQEIETIPYVKGRDRHNLLSRKLGQRFPDSTLATAFSLGHEKTRRKNERILLSALSNASDLEPWLERIAAAEAPLVGLYSLSQLAAPLLKKVEEGTGPQLLLTVQDNSLRESFVNGECVFTRLLPISDWEDEKLAATFANEAARLREYLIGRKLVGREEALPVFVVCHPFATTHLAKAFTGQDFLPCKPIDGCSLAKLLGAPGFPPDSRSEQLFLHLLAAKPPAQQFAPPAKLRNHRLLRMRQALAAVTAAILLAALSLTGKGYYDGRTYRQETALLLAQEQEMTRRHQEMSADLPRFPLSYDALEKLTDRLSALQQERGHPVESIQSLSHALDQAPAIELDTIDWKSTPVSGTAPACCQETLGLRGWIGRESKAAPHPAPAAFKAFMAALERERFFKAGPITTPLQSATGRIIKETGHTQETPQAFALQLTRTPSP